MQKNIFASFLLLSLLGCSAVDHAFAPHLSKASVSKPAPYSAPPITGKRKVGNPYKILGSMYYPIPESEGYTRKGIASWYGKDFHRKLTANGETYNMYDMTAAHPTLPIPTYVRVTNLENGLSTVVRVNDRGPFLRGRAIDLSYAAAVKLDMAEKGTAPVLLEALPTDGSTLHSPKKFTQAKPTPKAYKPAMVQPRNVVAAQQGIHAKEGSFTYRISGKSSAVSGSDNIPEKGAPVRIGAHEYYIQTGAFSNKDNALRQKAEVSGYYNKVNVTHFNRDNKAFYRVRIGPVSKVEEADEILSKMSQEGWTTARIVVD